MNAQPTLYSFEDSPEPPQLVNKGTDYSRITLSLLQFNDWLLSHRPDEALMRRVVAPGTSVERSTMHDIQILRQTNRRLFETTSKPDQLTIVSTSRDAISVRDVQYLTKEAIVDRNGKVVSEAPRETTTYLVLVVRRRDGLWYLASLDRTSTRP